MRSILGVSERESEGEPGLGFGKQDGVQGAVVIQQLQLLSHTHVGGVVCKPLPLPHCPDHHREQVGLLFVHRHLEHLGVHVHPRHGRGGGGDAHDGLSAVHVVTEPTKRHRGPEALHPAPHLVKQHHERNAPLQRGHARLVHALGQSLLLHELNGGVVWKQLPQLLPKLEVLRHIVNLFNTRRRMHSALHLVPRLVHMLLHHSLGVHA
mmetsp:Transcript_46358/g.88492  ORF Transcript_46358/g.88492 Transcript_46358/m.88492 type:complete len:208 (-) Transcript_46358:2546-3169(-)